MNIVIDSNILFSALIKNSQARKIILKYDGLFLFPSFIFEEMEKHEKILLRKSGMNNIEFDRLLHIILKKVLVIPKETLLNYKKEAMKIIGEIDPNDSVFIACALSVPGSVIWSNDKKLKKQDRIRILDTEEIVSIIKI